MPSPSDILINFVNEIINPTIFLLWVVGFLFFVWIFISYFLYDIHKEDAIDTLKRKIIYGVMGMFFLFAASGVVFFLEDIGNNLFR